MFYKKILYALGLLLLASFGYAVYEFFFFKAQRDAAVRRQATETTASLRKEIEALLTRVTEEGDRVAKLFGENDYSPDEVRQLLKESALSIPEIQGVTAAYEPFGLNEETRLFAPYYDKGRQTFIQVDESYDYTLSGAKPTAWYTTVRDDGTRWVEPYFGEAGQAWFVDLGVPFKYADGPHQGKVRGTITLSFLCSDLGTLIHKLSLGKTGYGFITSPDGTFLAHPNSSFVGQKQISDWIDESQTSKTFQQACQEIRAGKSGMVSFVDSETNDDMLFCYDHIPAAKWGMGVAFVKGDLLDDQARLYRRYVNLALLGSLLIVCILAIVYSRDQLDENEIWRLSIISSALLLANVFFVGWLEHQAERPRGSNISHPITDFASLTQYVDKRFQETDDLKRNRAIPIPTGIQIARMDFQDSYNLNVGGTVWQKIPPELAEEIEIGFEFPQISPFAEAALIEESYREDIGAKEGEKGYLLVGWRFRVTLQLNFRYSDYPFDKRQINIEIVPSDHSGAVILVPDLASYRFTNPSHCSGLDHSIILPGNEITESYFNFSVEPSDTDFGYAPGGRQRNATVLHFNVHLRRNLLNVFVTYLIPIAIALLMIFILLMACRKTAERQGIIESMAAFLFVLLFSHIDLRREVVTGQLIYLEFFYFITYAMVLLSTFNLMAYTLDKTKVFDFNDNQVFKAIYFPLFLLTVLIVTLVKFY